MRANNEEDRSWKVIEATAMLFSETIKKVKLSRLMSRLDTKKT